MLATYFRPSDPIGIRACDKPALGEKGRYIYSSFLWTPNISYTFFQGRYFTTDRIGRTKILIMQIVGDSGNWLQKCDVEQIE